MYKEMMKAIIKANNEGKGSYFGIRGDDFEHEIGQTLEESYDWDYENDCQSDEKLSGTCATNIPLIWFDGDEEEMEKLIEAYEYHVQNYQYKYTSIIVGENSEYGADEKEIIIEHAEVIYKIK